MDPAAIAAQLADRPQTDWIVVATDDSPRGLEACQSCLESLFRQELAVEKVSLVAPQRVVALLKDPAAARVSCHAVDPTGPGILRGIQAALSDGRSGFVSACDASATLCDDATLWIAVAAACHPRPRAVYADHVDDRPHLKPDFSWTYLLARNFVEPFVVYERALLAAALEALAERELRSACSAAMLYAVALEALHGLAPQEVLHVRQPLSAKPAAAAEQIRAADLPGTAAAALGSRGMQARVSCHADEPALHELEFRRTAAPKVSIVIPTKNAGALVRACIGSLRATACYENYEIVVIDHDSDEEDLRVFLAGEAAAGRLRVFFHRGPFNYAAMNNAAIRHTDGELLLLLNNDVDGFSAGWLDQMVATIELDERIAAVGGLLHYPNGSIQHAGVILTPKRPCIAAHAGLPHDALGYRGRIRSLQEFSAVTAALMLVRRSAFDAVGGFDEVFPDDYNDIDLCLRLRQAGFKIVYNPRVQANHWESLSRRPKETGKDLYRSRWRQYFASDPFYSPHLSPTAFAPDDLEHLWRERKKVALQAALGQLP